MFNLSGSEIVFLLLLALIVLGPEKLPEAVRRFGKFYGEFKKMSTGFQTELKTALDEPMREMRETAEAFKKAANFDFEADDDDDDRDDDVVSAEQAVVASTATETSPTESATADETEPAVPPAVMERPTGPTFHSAAPQQPKVIEAVQEPASE
jgi:sec-independent protein translocase protein TatB